MARPRSEDKRNAMIEAATRVIGTHGLSAPTAMIAKEAGVSNGSLFAYFETKADLLNQLYVGLKAEMAAVALDGSRPRATSARRCSTCGPVCCAGQFHAPRNAGRSRSFLYRTTLLRRAVRKRPTRSSGVIQLLERGRENGPMRDAPLGFVAVLMTALLDATIDYMIQDPANADKHCLTAFDAFWRMIA